MASCNDRYFPDGPVNACQDQWFSWWMCKCPKKDPLTILFWLFIGLLAKAYYQAIGGCKFATPECEGKECGPDGLGGICGECGFGQACTVEQVCCPIPVAKLAQYEGLVDIYPLTVVLNLTPQRRKTLFRAIADLECKNTSHWHELQDFSIAALTQQQMELVWLRRAAVCLYHDVAGVFAWKLSALTVEQLFCLMGLTALENNSYLGTQDYYGCDFKWGEPGNYVPVTVWANDPMTVNAMAMKILDYASEKSDFYDVSSPQSLLFALVDYMRHELDWQEIDIEIGESFPAHPGCGACHNIEDLFYNGAGGCNMSAPIVRHIMRCLNVPVINGLSPMAPGHFGIHALLPDTELMMLVGSDAIQAPDLRHLPAKHSFVEPSVFFAYAEMIAGPSPGEFEATYDMLKQVYLAWFSYYSANNFWTVQLYDHFFKKHIFYLNSTISEEIPWDDFAGRDLNLPLVPIQNPEGKLLKDDPEVASMIEFLMWDYFCNTGETYEALAWSIHGKEYEISQETDPVKLAKLLEELAELQVLWDMAGCASGKVCVDHGGYSSCE